MDFGGTLVRGLTDPADVFARVLHDYDVRWSRERWSEAEQRVADRMAHRRYDTFGATRSFWDAAHVEMLRELGVPDPDGAIVLALHDKFTSPESHPPFPETIGVLQRFRREGPPLHLVSNNTDYLLETVSRLGWTDYFGSITYSQEAGAEKPDPRVFRLALERAGVGPQDALHVGDSWEADYLGATKAGLRAVWLNRAQAPPPAPCETIGDLRDLVTLVSARR